MNKLDFIAKSLSNRANQLILSGIIALVILLLITFKVIIITEPGRFITGLILGIASPVLIGLGFYYSD